MRVEIDEHSGFCFGVTSAIEKAEEELKAGPLCCLGDIVHNGQEVARLEQAGLKTIDYEQFKSMNGGRVLLRAHGEPPSTYETARCNGIEIIDASCPVVLHLQKRIRSTYLAHPDAQIVIFGKVGHAEVIGLQGQTDNTAIVIESIEQIDRLDYTRPIYLFSQTTKSVEEFKAIVEAIQYQISNLQSQIDFEYHDTICRNVANRVEELKTFARSHEQVFFVGGLKSSNAKVLFEHCREANPNTLFVSSPDEIQKSDILPVGTIGICGATSTPLWLMRACKDKIETLWNTTLKQSAC